jgi:hypothetical protein
MGHFGPTGMRGMAFAPRVRGGTMFFADVIFAIALGVLFALLFGSLFGSSERVPGFLMLFLVFFLFAWAGGLWIGPLGPAIVGVYWLPGFVVTLLIFLLIGGISYHRPTSTRETEAEIEARRTTAAAFGILIWILIAALVVAVIVAYLV